jgi:hypothetical protein
MKSAATANSAMLAAHSRLAGSGSIASEAGPTPMIGERDRVRAGGAIACRGVAAAGARACGQGVARATRSIASMLRSTSSSRVAHEHTLMRIAV